MIDQGLYQFCTVRQGEILKAVEEHGSHRRAAESLGIKKSTISSVMAA